MHSSVSVEGKKYFHNFFCGLITIALRMIGLRIKGIIVFMIKLLSIVLNLPSIKEWHIANQD